MDASHGPVHLGASVARQAHRIKPLRGSSAALRPFQGDPVSLPGQSVPMTATLNRVVTRISDHLRRRPQQRTSLERPGEHDRVPTLQRNMIKTLSHRHPNGCHLGIK